jgi:hypothetical protein
VGDDLWTLRLRVLDQTTTLIVSEISLAASKKAWPHLKTFGRALIQ